MKKILFALLLTLAMVLSLFPSSVIAAGTEADPLSAMVDGTCVQVAELQGELPEGVSLSVEKLEGEKAALYLQDMAKWGVNVKDNSLVLDVKLLDEKGMPYQPEEYGQLVQLSFQHSFRGEHQGLALYVRARCLCRGSARSGDQGSHAEQVLRPRLQ